MRILITAGNTQTPIDQVRCITNIFTGRTGGQIALEAHRRGHDVTLLTSHPEAVGHDAPHERWSPRSYRTFEDLANLMAALIPGNNFDALIHAAAVSDFHVDGRFSEIGGKALEASTGKISSRHPELWLRLTPTPKLADQVRSPWGFRGTFVKFKLEVGITNVELRTIASRSRSQSDADLIVANTLAGKDVEAFIGDRANDWERTARAELAAKLIDRVEAYQNACQSRARSAAE